MIVSVTIAAIGAIAMLALRAWITHEVADRMAVRPEGLPQAPIAIVFGAGVWPSGRLSDILADRVETAVELYQARKVQKLLMTGDNRVQWYNEPAAMGTYAMELGVPEIDIVYDYAGRRTYDSCYRAQGIFGITQAILVTQEYHLPRALYTCRALGIDATGIAADRRTYIDARRYAARELPALVLAWWETHVTHPLPIMGDPIPITYD